jgi:hypothetical protein
MHQCLIQWHGNNDELVYANDSVSIATSDPMYWELEDFECFPSTLWEGGFIRINDEGQQLI